MLKRRLITTSVLNKPAGKWNISMVYEHLAMGLAGSSFFLFFFANFYSVAKMVETDREAATTPRESCTKCFGQIAHFNIDDLA